MTRSFLIMYIKTFFSLSLEAWGTRNKKNEYERMGLMEISFVNAFRDRAHTFFSTFDKWRVTKEDFVVTF